MLICNQKLNLRQISEALYNGLNGNPEEYKKTKPIILLRRIGLVFTGRLNWQNLSYMAFKVLLLFHKLISDSLERFDVVVANFFAQFPDVNINRAVAHNHIIAPNRIIDFFPCEYFPGFGNQ